ncbi:MAG: LacI family DNA-binding transcriptional regulator [Alphaproteobacteria bacterium]|nr:LacI family DNA-binding transcriptional regulator [Alphaproteobacteria bacterium]
MATMKDVARRAGVSIATVSTTLSGSSYVSPALKERVQAAIDELGYAPNAMASGLKRGRSAMIGLVVPDITNPFFTEFVHVVQREARAAGYSVMLGVSDDDAAQEADLVRLMRSHQAAGTILCPCGNEDDTKSLRGITGAMPLVAVDNAADGTDFDTVVIDNRQAARLAVDHIVSAGHERIAAITGPTHRFVSRERLIGFEEALKGHGLKTNPQHIMPGEFHVSRAYEAGLSLLQSPNPPTAIFVANNQMLIGILQALAHENVAVPQDMSIASIDDFAWTAAVTPALTTVTQPIAEMARIGLERLIGRIGGDDSPPHREMLSPGITVRTSCAVPRAGDLRRATVPA